MESPQTDDALVIERRVKKILRSIELMRPIPMVITRILRSLDEPGSSAGYVSEIIGLDQALAANVLQAANSAFLGYGPSCATLKEAVMRLGYKRIRTLVLAVAASSGMDSSLAGYNLAAGDMWAHSVATAVAAQWFARAINYSEPEEAYAAGLLHDIGKIVLNKFIEEDYRWVFNNQKKINTTLIETERKTFGVDHSYIGSLMAQKWTFPMVLINAIQFHHNPGTAGDHKALAAITNVANALTPVDPETLSRLGPRQVDDVSYSILRITPDQLMAMNNQMVTYYKMNFGVGR
ncbi:MAG: HDOD domain-containing protein [Leptolinea sp.]|jgi:putative nucleotidyltransferase with HDIG domain|nr:HDOD domain-containing protein [Leptolinea sp.]